MKIAFIIHAHNQPYLLARLLRSLGNLPEDVYLHVDRDVALKNFTDAIQVNSNVTIVDRYRSKWGTFGQIQAIISSIHKVLSVKKYYDRIVFLSGQDYPIKSNEEIRSFFENNAERDYIKYWSIPYSGWTDDNGGVDRLLKKRYYMGKKCYVYPMEVEKVRPYFRLLAKIINIVHPTVKLHSLPLYGGWSWWNLKQETIELIYDFIERNPEYTKMYKQSFCGDEIYVQTILMHLVHTEKIPDPVNDDLRFVDWVSERRPLPAILDETDYLSIAKSNALFARKMHLEKSIRLLNKIDENILHVYH